ncbi:hypothetical protein TNCT_665421 [Trichonephila clavata]|uniref:Uncharacterized protein n=1 Tax=Trichonephila clavata TaxID=2740835 RepID=A0A8X6G9J6_TRICU|nr:hypothetical protein TNCT_665421 [Trichonephila clavata]
METYIKKERKKNLFRNKNNTCPDNSVKIRNNSYTKKNNAFENEFQITKQKNENVSDLQNIETLLKVRKKIVIFYNEKSIPALLKTSHSWPRFHLLRHHQFVFHLKVNEMEHKKILSPTYDLMATLPDYTFIFVA